MCMRMNMRNMEVRSSTERSYDRFFSPVRTTLGSGDSSDIHSSISNLRTN
jgi:hypothetical protein